MEHNEDADGADLPRIRPQDLPPQEKLRLVLEAAALAEEELGEFLRREGVHEAQLTEWRECAFSGALDSLADKPRRAEARSRRERDLERELRRKEKALAETAALLVLRGKLDALLAEEGDDTKRT